MPKIFLVILLFISSLYGVEMGKSGGCTLTQSGTVKVGYNNVKLEKIEYTPNKKVGKNFRELFVGATVAVTLPATGKNLLPKHLTISPTNASKENQKQVFLS
ncbi:MAG: hypothetical protein FAF04_01270 [Epsilonproteobacteria bacterium]|nr:hypothetical protein [Campylobacterota bacterium]